MASAERQEESGCAGSSSGGGVSSSGGGGGGSSSSSKCSGASIAACTATCTATNVLDESVGASATDVGAARIVRPTDSRPPSGSSASSRAFFDAPRPDARRCSRAVFAILVSLTVWVGLWDLFDYSVLPLLTDHNGTSLCGDAEANPGPAQLIRAPGCIALKLLLIAIGVVGLWATRSLYGANQVHSAMFTRLR